MPVFFHRFRSRPQVRPNPRAQ